MKTLIALTLAVTGAGFWYTQSPTSNSQPPAPASQPGPNAPAAFQGPPVGGPAFAQAPPAGYPASFNVSYSGPDGSFATTCYFTGVPTENIWVANDGTFGGHMVQQRGEIYRWVSTPVSTSSLRGPVVVSFHHGIKLSTPTAQMPSGAWLVEVGNANSGLSAASNAFSSFGSGIITVN